MKVAIMQPYFIPYIGYFQLVSACDHFIFLDNVQYIERGWINRNRLLVNGKTSYITIPVKKSSQKTLILDKLIHPSLNTTKILSTIRHEYKHHQYFYTIYDLIFTLFKNRDEKISTLCSNSIITLSEYIGLNTQFHFASELMPNSLSCTLNAENRIIQLIYAIGGSTYSNMRGGENLYNIDQFLKRKLEIVFIDPCIIPYPQPNNNFVPALSIIDMLMNLSIREVKHHCQLSQ